MTNHKLIKLLVAAAAFILTNGHTIQAHAPAAQANLTVAPAQEPWLSQAANTTIASQCATCHHSELLSRVDQLTTNPRSDLRPAWSPDGTRIAFYSGRSGNDDVWAINVDGSAEAQLTQDPASDRRPSWSPDGTRIAFDSDRAGSRDIWVMNADGSDQRQLTTAPGEELFASFSPNGSQILFFAYQDGRNDIWAMDADGGNLRPLTKDLADVQRGQCTFACHQPAWSPDGTKIAFHADQQGKRHIWVMDADGGNPRQLTAGTINNYLPSWTPDGRIIFMAERSVAQKIRFDIQVMDADGGNETTLFAEVAHGGPFVWSPDGTRVALHSQRGSAGNFDIFVATFGAVAEEGVPEVVEAPTPGEVTEEKVEEAPIPEEGTPPVTVAPALRLVGSVAVVAGLTLLVALVGLAVVIYGLRGGFRRD
ncbi:MAG: hypothetical protein ACE5LU_07050 [Anaerolineae bacterium]